MFYIFIFLLIPTNAFGVSLRVHNGFVGNAHEQEEEIYSYEGTSVYMSMGSEDPPVGITEQTLVSQKLNHPDLWNLDRIDNDCGVYTGYYKYFKNSDSPQVVAYILDTGIYGHPDLGDRFIGGHSFVDDCSINYGDEHGHGTFVATQIAGDVLGSCKDDCLVYSTKVMGADGGGTSSGVIRGIFHSVQHCQDNGFAHCLINMSLGGGYYSPINEAVKFAYDAGLMIFVSAGNSNIDACGASPASAVEAWTVGASNQADEKAYFSNFGPCVDFYAPGKSVLGGGLDGGYKRKSGTSMSSPTAAGLVAKFWMETPELGASSMHDLVRGLVVNSPLTGLPMVVRHHSRTVPAMVPGANATSVAFEGCIKYTAVVQEFTRIPYINFQLINSGDEICDGVGDNSISGSISKRRITVGNDDDDGTVSRWGAYLVGHKIGVPFQIKMDTHNYKFTVSFDDRVVFSMVYDGSVDILKLYSQSSTIVEYSNIIKC